jgi:hypothetical protein
MSALAEQILQISVNYLGPAAKKFLERQTYAHMNGLVFDDIRPDHLPQLAWWIHASSKLYIDYTKAKEFSEKIDALASQPGPHAQ